MGEEHPEPAELLRLALGRRIVCVHEGPWDEYPSLEMPGVAGPIWDYGPIFLSLDDGSVLQLGSATIRFVPAAPEKAQISDLRDDAGISCLGFRITDLVDSLGSRAVFLEDGRCIENGLTVGGTCLRVERADDWAADHPDHRSLVR